MDIFGIGYIGFSSTNPLAWAEYAPKILGMEVGTAPSGDDEGTVFLRTDDHQFRFAIEPGEWDDVAFIGWEVPGRDEYRAALARFGKKGVAFEEGDHALRKKRGVRELAVFHDPIGYRHEIFYAPYSMPGSFRGARSHAGFDAGIKGPGHVVLVSPIPLDKIDELFQDVMGFKFLTHGAAQSRSGPTGNSFLRPKLS